MKIKRIQFIGMPPILNGSVAARYLEPNSRAGIVDIVDGYPNAVVIKLRDGQEMSVDQSQVYVWRDGAPASEQPVKVEREVVKAKQGAEVVTVYRKRGRPKKSAPGPQPVASNG